MKTEEWLKNQQIGLDIWEKKYRANHESFREWLDRVSGGNQAVRKLIEQRKFLFGGRILANRGLDKQGQKITLSNCYVMEAPDDNLESIFACAAKLARTYSYGGGCGVDISKLAPRGAAVRNAAKSTSGAISWMDLYSATTGLIGQSGRRGALMISLSVDHPDIEEFIACKEDLNRITKANISVRVSNAFMQAVLNNTTFPLYFQREATGEVIEKIIDARSLFQKLAAMNHDMGEPGILFWDQIRNWNLLSECPGFQFGGVNPCGEEPLPANGSCLLGSLNLSEFVEHPFSKQALFDCDAFAKAARTAVIALDGVLEEGLPLHPLAEQRETVATWRQIGLGVMGVADMFIKMGIRYGSDISLKLIDTIGHTLINAAVMQSSLLAKEYRPYPAYDWHAISTSEFLKYNIDEDVYEHIKQYGLRHSQLLTIAPTGSISTMLGVSGGVEPIYALSYSRKTESLHGKDVSYQVETPIVSQYRAATSLKQDTPLPDYFVTAALIAPKERIKAQAAWQRHIDAAISSTINLPQDSTVEDVEAIYMSAWQAGLKGVTVFRDGCRRTGILSVGTTKRIKDNQLQRGDIIDVSNEVVGKKRKLVSGCGSLHCAAFFDPVTGHLMETYFSKGSTGGCNNFMIALSRMISLAARSGCDISSIIDQLKSSGVCPSYAVRTALQKDTSKGACCPAAIANALFDMWREKQEDILSGNEDEAPLPVMPSQECAKCPECGMSMVHSGGCSSCIVCGFSKCQ